VTGWVWILSGMYSALTQREELAVDRFLFVGHF